jgi:hypothetical protein
MSHYSPQKIVTAPYGVPHESSPMSHLCNFLSNYAAHPVRMRLLSQVTDFKTVSHKGRSKKTDTHLGYRPPTDDWQQITL